MSPPASPLRPLPSAVLFFLAAAGVALGQGELAAELAVERDEETLLSLLRKGGPVMIPLALCSVVALGIAVERWLSLRRGNLVPKGFVSRLTAAMREGGAQEAGAVCEQSGTVAARVFKAGLRQVPHGRAAVEKAIEDAGGREVHKLKRSLRWLAVIASISPLLGLLGTVYGMIRAFQTATAVGMGKAEVLAQGIYEALVTTAAGLTIAIPVLLVYQFLSSRIEARVDEIDAAADEFLVACDELGAEKERKATIKGLSPATAAALEKVR